LKVWQLRLPCPQFTHVYKHHPELPSAHFIQLWEKNTGPKKKGGIPEPDGAVCVCVCIDSGSWPGHTHRRLFTVGPLHQRSGMCWFRTV